MDLLVSGIAEFLSCDGQLYVGCARCGREARVHYRWVADPAHGLKAACKTCGSELKDFVRHLFDDVHRCRDCDNRFQSKSAGFEATSCSRCGSSNVELLERQLYPPFPSSFDQIAPPKKHPWGTLLNDDLSHMRSELGLARSQLDFADYLLLNARLCERLQLANDYPPETVGIALSNELANLWLEHCRQTDSLESGLRALALFIEIGAQPPGLNDHYAIALTCDVLLLRFNEVTLAAEGFPSLRADAIAHARAAAAIAESRLAVDPNGALTLAQTEVLLSRLLAARRAGVDEKLEAVAVAERALNRNVLSVEGASDVRVSRAAIVVDLPDADAALLGQAIDALEQNVAELRTSGPAERLCKNLFNLGQLYHRIGRALDAIRLLQESAEVSRRLLVQCGTPEMLAKAAGKYLFVFEALASQLAAAGRGRDALVAYETLRGVVPRVAANESQRTQMAVRSTLELLERMALSEDPTYRPDDPSEFPSPDVDGELQAVCTQLLDVKTVLIYYGWFGDRATALLIHIGAADAHVCIEALQWPFLDFPSRTVEGDALQDLRTGYGQATSRVPPLFNAMVYADPGPLRNLRLHDASLDAYRYLLEPLEERLKALGAKRVAVCAAGLLSAVSFETITTRERPNWFFADEAEICYLPSVGIAANLARQGRTIGSRLLIIGYSGSSLPGVEMEIDVIRNRWRGEITVLRGADLNKKSAIEALSNDYDFIHFAGHGTFDLDVPLKSAFYFAGDLVDPRDDAYRLTAEDLLTVSLSQHPIVTLSACSSLVWDDAHRLSGLPGSLLQVGASAIIGCRWPVSDDVARTMMGDTYAAIADGATPFCAFTRAQRAMRATHELEDWGAFSYLGLPW